VSKSPLPQTCCDPGAVLWLWPGQAIYNGPALDLGAHSGSVACLAIGLDDVFTVLTAERRDLTTAATDAGFASPSHFSEAFHRMFGLQPSRLLAAGVTIIDATVT
jgi:hypothetical protein